MGVSENSVPLNPMVNDHYPYEMAIIGNIPYFQTNPYLSFFVNGTEASAKDQFSVDDGRLTMSSRFFS